MTTNKSSYYFYLQTSWGITKHMGGVEASRKLMKVCQINKDSYVLDVGCGVGITACFLAMEYGCKVIGVDISDKMVERSRKRAKRKKVKDNVEFKIGNAQALPFKDGVFDAVICESVIAFTKDKQQVINEFVRVTKPSGYVGINEVTWLETPPIKLEEYTYLALGKAEFLNPNGWKDLLEKANLSGISTNVFKTKVLRQWISEVRYIDPIDFLSAWGKFFFLCFKSGEARKWLKEISIPPRSIFSVFKFLGYGIYVGRK